MVVFRAMTTGEHIAQNLLDIEHLHQPSVGGVAVDTGDSRYESGGGVVGCLHVLPVHMHDLEDFVDHKRLGRSGKLGDQHDAHSGFRCAARSGRQVNHRNQLSAHIGQTFHVLGAVDNVGELRVHHNFPHLEDVDPENLLLLRLLVLAKFEQHKFELSVGVGMRTGSGAKGIRWLHGVTRKKAFQTAHYSGSVADWVYRLQRQRISPVA